MTVEKFVLLKNIRVPVNILANQVVLNETERLNIEHEIRFDGFVAHQESTDQFFKLVGGTLNENWQLIDIASPGGPSGHTLQTPVGITYNQDGMVYRTIADHGNNKYVETRVAYNNGRAIVQEIRDDVSNRFVQIGYIYTAGRLTNTTVTNITQFSI